MMSPSVQTFVIMALAVCTVKIAQACLAKYNVAKDEERETDMLRWKWAKNIFSVATFGLVALMYLAFAEHVVKTFGGGQ